MPIEKERLSPSTDPILRKWDLNMKYVKEWEDKITIDSEVREMNIESALKGIANTIRNNYRLTKLWLMQHSTLSNMSVVGVSFGEVNGKKREILFSSEQRLTNKENQLILTQKHINDYKEFISKGNVVRV